MAGRPAVHHRLEIPEVVAVGEHRPRLFPDQHLMGQQADLAPGLPDDLGAHDAEPLIDRGVGCEGVSQGRPAGSPHRRPPSARGRCRCPSACRGRRRPCWPRGGVHAAFVVDEVGWVGGHQGGAPAVHQAATSLGVGGVAAEQAVRAEQPEVAGPREGVRGASGTASGSVRPAVGSASRAATSSGSKPSTSMS